MRNIQFYTVYKDGEQPRNVTPVDLPAWIAEGWKAGDELPNAKVFDSGRQVVEQPPIVRESDIEAAKGKGVEVITAPTGEITVDGGKTWLKPVEAPKVEDPAPDAGKGKGKATTAKATTDKTGAEE